MTAIGVPAGLDTAEGATERSRASLAVAGWTLISRGTGFLRAVMVATVLGATYLGNVYQALMVLPNFAFGLLTGALFSSLLVPSLVELLDRGDRRGAEALAGSFLGLLLLAALVLVAVTIAAAEVVLGLLSIAVADPALAAAQREAGWLLLVTLMPQLLLYVLAATATAVLMAHGRFAVASAAPALENAGIILTLGLTALLFASGAEVGEAPPAELLLLGLGTTGAVGLHAGLVWWHAARSGTRLRPRAGWRDPQARAVVRLLRPSLAYTALETLPLWLVIVVANAVPGGVVVFWLAFNFVQLPLAIGARPITTTFLPALSRLRHAGALADFRDELDTAIRLAAFLTVPAAVGMVVLAWPLGDALAVAHLAEAPAAVEMLAVALAGMAVGLVGRATFVIATDAAYALGDPVGPVLANAVRAALVLTGVGIATALDGGIAVMLALALAVAVGDVAGAACLRRRLRRKLPPPGRHDGVRLPWRPVSAALAMAVPAGALAFGLAPVVGEVAAVVSATLAGALIYAAVQRRLGAPELAFFARGLPRMGRGGRA